ncbi:MAG: efflux RND transporter periplasmic adaptor subunit [Nitrospirota bacterium]
MKNLRWVALSILVLIIGCAKPPEKETKIEAISVVTATPAISDIILTTTLQGTVLPIREAKISPKMGGKLLKIYVKENDPVQQGDVVANLDPTDAQLRLLQAEAGLSTAKAGLKQAETNLELVKIEFERAERLKETNSIAQSAFDKANTGYKMACAQLELANAQVNQAQVAVASARQGLEDTNITAPISGIITSKCLNEGEVISQMNLSSPILTVMDISTVKVELAVSEDLITKIKRGSKAEVYFDAYPNKRFTGIISNIFPTVNSQSRTFSCFLHIPNPQHLIKPGMFCRVTLDLERHEGVLCIPQGAVFNRGLDNYLYVVEKNHARLKQIKLGIQDLEKMEITEGLNQDEEVVIRGVENLQDGVLVRIIREVK